MPVTFKDAPVKTKKQIVGTVNHPVFDEKNPDIGLEDILSYDWGSHGYASAKAAIVSLVNTQHATNLKNDFRAKKSGKMTGEKLNNLALARLAALPPDQLAALASSGSIAAKVEEFKAQIKAEAEAAAASAPAADDDDDDENE